MSNKQGFTIISTLCQGNKWKYVVFRRNYIKVSSKIQKVKPPDRIQEACSAFIICVLLFRTAHL